MAIKYVDSRVGSVVVPSSFSSINVRTPVSGLSASGILALIGEADAGPATSATGENIEDNYFTPDQLGDVISKYTSGNLVDGFRAAATASNDSNIVGSPTRIYLYKTNASTSATSSILGLGYASYGSLAALSEGRSGNALTWDADTATSAVEPTTGYFSYVPAGVTYEMKYRQHGGANVSFTITANMTPPALASRTSSLQSSSFLVLGGADRSSFSSNAGITLSAVTATGNVAAFTLVSSAFAVSPVAGDVLSIPSGSAFSGAGNVNQGFWVVSSASNVTGSATFTAKKLHNTSATTGNETPINVSTTFAVTPANDMVIYSPVKFVDKSGVNRGSLASLTASTLAFVVTGSSAVATLNTGTFSAVSSVTRPRVGDSVFIPSSSTLVGTADANQGFWSVSAVTDSSLSMDRVSNGTPVTVASGAVGATPNSNILVIRPYIDGQQSALEISNGSGALALSTAFYDLGTTTAATFLSTAATPYLVTGTDYQATVSINRSTDNTQESFTDIGGNVALHLGYLGTTCSAVVSDTLLTTTVTGGNGSNLSITLSDYDTLNDLVTFINQNTGYAAEVPNAAAGNLSPEVLDNGTWTAGSTVAANAYPCRIKRDVSDFVDAIAGSAVIDFTSVAGAGLPEATASATLLAGGSKGGSTAAQFATGVDAMENINVNFIVPLISQDATTDITEGLTEATSTYTIAGVNAYLKSHCTSLSGQVKRRKNRLGIGSIWGTFAQAKAAAAALASARYALTFQKVKNTNSSGTLLTYQPWMLAVEAASMQAVGTYRSITRKYMNISGIVNPSGFSPQNYGQLEQALVGGLLTIEAPAGGGFRFVSDQTTYGKDDNFVYNSLQVMYTGDIMALDLASAFDNFAVGQAVSSLSAGVGKSFLEAKMSQYLQAKFISPSDGAAAGYDSASVRIVGPVMTVGVNIYITGAIYFVPITLDISQVSQTA